MLEAWASFQREIRVQRAKSSAVLGGRLLFGVEFVSKALLGAGAAAPRAGQGLTPGGDARSWQLWSSVCSALLDLLLRCAEGKAQLLSLCVTSLGSRSQHSESSPVLFHCH